jgi:hypothetical protein
MEEKEIGILDLAKALSVEFHFNEFVKIIVDGDIKLEPNQIATLKMTFYAGIICLNGIIEQISSLPFKDEAKTEMMTNILAEVELYVLSKEKGKQLLQ